MADRSVRRSVQARQEVPSAFGDDIVVRTRFIPPRLRPQLIARPRLYGLLAKSLHCPLTVLKAEAGYGKTTTVSLFLEQSGLPSCWYNLGEGDADPQSFLLHLIHLFRSAYGQLGERALALLAQEHGAARLWAPAVDALANDLLDALSHETILVLDNYDAVNRHEINAITERLVEHMPPQLHLVLTMRSLPSLPAWPRWRGSGELLEIGPRELAFSPDEIMALLARRSSRGIAPQAAELLASETEGWPIAVQMLSEGLEDFQDKTLEQLLRRMPRRSELLFDYLAEEVFARQPPEIQDFLARTACLRRLEAQACDALLSQEGSAQTLRYLERHSLFVTHEGTARYHHLFRDFLLRRSGLAPGEHRRLHHTAAAYYQQRDEVEEAVFHLLSAQDYPAAAALLSSIARPIVYSGRHHALAAWLDQLPPDLLERYPELLLARGHAYRFGSRYREALESYVRAQQRFAALADQRGETRALRGQALIYLDTVQPALAAPLLRQARQKIERGSADRAAILTLLAENKINAGQLRRAEWLQRAISRASGDSTMAPIDPRLYVRQGRFAQGRHILESDLRSDPCGAGQWRAPRSHRETAALIAWVDAMTGEAERARNYAAQSLELGKLLGSPIVECLALSRLGHSWLAGVDFDLSRARLHYHEALAIAEQIGVRRFKVEPLLGLTLVAGLESNLAEAEARASEALATLAETGDRYMSAILQLALGAALTLCDGADAELWLQRAAQLGHNCGDSFGPCASELWLALRLARCKRNDAALETFLRALASSQRHGYEFLFTGAPLLGPREVAVRRALLRRAQRDPVLGAYASRLARRLDPPASSSEHFGPAESPATAPLFIQTLGRFRVWRAGREIERGAWGREKAVMLLQFLICHRGRVVHREQILEALWPDSSPSAAATGLRVALSALRQVLDPDRTGETSGRFIGRGGEGLQLDLSGGVRLDVDEFARLMHEAQNLSETDPDRSIELYEAALALYHGDFLSESPYAEWADEEREQRLVGYLLGAERLAKVLVGRGEYERGARWATAILARDPLWEEAYALLMRCHRQQGNRALAVRIYDRCRKRLAEALGVEPLPETTALFEEICRSS